jgi:hypothetical protein
MTDATGNHGDGNGSRLDRIEALLVSVAEQQAESARQAAESKRQSDERMARLEVGLAETKAIADSNARSIQAWEAKFATQDRDIDRLALVAADVESGTRTLAIAVRDIFNVIMDRLEQVEARLPDEGSNGA